MQCFAAAARVAFRGLTLLSLFLSGCYAGAAGVALGVLSLSDDGGGGNDALPEVTQPLVKAVDCRDLVRIEFEIANDDQGHLTARIEYVTLDGAMRPNGPPRPATPGAGSDDLETVQPLETVRFLWDAKTDLKENSALVEISVTPLEDGAAGRPFRSEPIRAGNTPVVIRNVNLASRDDFIDVSFELVDQESDPITLVGLELCLDGLEAGGKDGARFYPLPDDVFQELPENMRENLPSRPEGARSSLTFPTSRLDGVDELQALALPGFAGDVCARVSGHDCEGEAVSKSIPGCFRFSNNVRPFAQILPSRVRPATGVIPIRYRLFDEDENPADVEVRVDLGDGFVPANEFPSSASDGTRGLDTEQVDDAEPDIDTTGPFHTFLWDALSQSQGGEEVMISLRPRDREDGTIVFDRLQLSRSPLEFVREIRLCTEPQDRPFVLWTTHAIFSRDFNGDTIEDVVVFDYWCDEISYLAGGPQGLKEVAVNIPVGEKPWTILITPDGDLDGDGFRDLLVTNTASPYVTYLRGGPDGLSQARARPVPVGGPPFSGTIGDFDRDGHPDALVAHWDGVTGGVTHLSKWDRTGPAEQKEVLEGGRPLYLVKGDFNNDQNIDLAVSLFDAGKIAYIPGDEGGLRWESRRDIEVGGIPLIVLSEDFDRDNFPDLLATTTVGETWQWVTWLRGGADGLVGDKPGPPPRRKDEIRLRDVAGPIVLATGDFNGDGHPDAALTQIGELVTYLQSSAEGFLEPRSFEAGEGGYSLGVGDIDRDGFLDVLVPNTMSNDVAYLRGGPEGLTAPAWRFPVRDQPARLVCGDFDGDGGDEVAVASSSDFVAYFRPAPGGLTGREEIDAGSPSSVAVSDDFDGDGLLDVVTGSWESGELSYLRGGPGGLKAGASMEIGGSPVALANGDFDGDGCSDLVVADVGYDDAGKVLFLRGGNGGFSGESTILHTGDAPRTLASVDFDGDKLPDVVVGNRDSDTVTYLRGSRDAGLTESQEIRVGTKPRALGTGDFDGDGFVDVVVANWGSGDVTYLRWNDKEKRFHRPGEHLPVGRAPLAIETGDYNGDGFTDAVVANEEGTTVTFLPGAPGGLTHCVDVDVGGFPVALARGDYDGDGFFDVAVAVRGTDEVVYLHGSPGGLSYASRVSVGHVPRTLVSSDYNGDGFLDVVTANSGSNDISYLRGGAGDPAPERRLERADDGGEPRALTVGDYDGDGFLDLLVGSYHSDRVTYFPSRFLVPHANRRFDPESMGNTGLGLIDPRNPPSYELQLPPRAFALATQVCIVPRPLFALPQSEWFKNGSFLIAVTDCVAILREDTQISGKAKLTLRLRDQLFEDVLDRREGLHAFHQEEDGKVKKLSVAVEIGEFASGKGVSFPIERFGVYAVAIERGLAEF